MRAAADLVGRHQWSIGAMSADISAIVFHAEEVPMTTKS